MRLKNMDTKVLRKRIDLMAYLMAGTFLAIHIAMLIIFIVNNVSPMIYVNIGSIIFYAVMLFLIFKSHLSVFAVATYLEINAHMMLAIIFTSWGAGFQITVIGIVILLFFCEYIARSLNLKYVPSICLAPVAAIVYIVSFVITLLVPPAYVLPETVNITLQISWAVIVFAIMSAVLFVFVSTTTRSQSELTSEVVHDKLTGLPNRYYMASCFQEIEEDQAHKHWIAIADLDDFKSINDTHGHNCGDYVLKAFASLLEEASKDIVICRWGGEEFLLLGDEMTPSPEKILEGVRQRVESYPFLYEGISMKLTVTIGFAWKKEGQSVDEWIAEADKRLYEGKENGKNKICWK